MLDPDLIHLITVLQLYRLFSEKIKTLKKVFQFVAKRDSSHLRER
ncbi:hypothetical protein SD78_3740 [Bacillus badius]|nr:hypothetical protein SD78_3740 [Bacillus badius]